MSEQKIEENSELSIGAMAILNVAEALFAQKGFKATAISEIAKKAAVSKANIYHHFKSKEHLYQAALALACERVFKVMELSDLAFPDNPVLRLKEYVSRHLQSMLEQPISSNLIKRELMDNTQVEGRMLAKDIFTNTFNKVASLVLDVHQIDESSEDNHAYLQAFILISVNVFFFDSQSVMKYLPGISTLADSPETFSNTVFDFIMNSNTKPISHSEEGNANE